MLGLDSVCNAVGSVVGVSGLHLFGCVLWITSWTTAPKEYIVDVWNQCVFKAKSVLEIEKVHRVVYR